MRQAPWFLCFFVCLATVSSAQARSFESRAFNRPVAAIPEDPRLSFEAQDSAFLTTFGAGEEALILKTVSIGGRSWVQIVGYDAKSKSLARSNRARSGAAPPKAGWMSVGELQAYTSAKGRRSISESSVRRLIDECLGARERLAGATKRSQRSPENSSERREASYLALRARSKLEQLGCEMPPERSAAKAPRASKPQLPQKSAASISPRLRG